MKFGFSMFGRPDRDAKEPMREMFRVAERAGDLGYDHLAVGHHCSTPDSRYPYMILAALAARTTRIRLGTAIQLITLQHRLDIAEEVATLGGFRRPGHCRRRDRLSPLRVRGAGYPLFPTERPPNGGIPEDMIVAGPPDDCVEGVQRFEQATGCEYFHLFLGSEVDTDWGIEQLEMFYREVMPAFAEKAPA